MWMGEYTFLAIAGWKAYIWKRGRLEEIINRLPTQTIIFIIGPKRGCYFIVLRIN